MKSLTLFRHAKSGWDDAGLRDFDRPLNARGRRAAAAMGRHWRSEGLAFDRVLASPATRVVETLDGVAAGYGARLWPDWDRRLYLASAATMLDLVQAMPSAAARVLLVGHNPGLEDLAALLAEPGTDDRSPAIAEAFPTAALAEIAFDIDDWRGVQAGAGRLTRFVRPRDLDPSLGPED